MLSLACSTIRSMRQTIELFLVFIVAFGAKAQNATCPQPVVCDANPCNGIRCLRFMNSECRVDSCRGECRATFFRSTNGKEVTSRCAAPTCAQKRCPARRMCVNRVLPPTCPTNRPNCRQYISPQCVLPPPPQPPTNCAVIQCPTDRPVCEVRQTRQGPRARCVLQPPPTSCETVECDEGMECQVREREGLDPVVRCKPIRVVPTPRDCSELDCSDGLVCMVTNGSAICVEPPPLPNACEELDCEEQNLECRTLTILNFTRAICLPISDCNRLVCNESEGIECRVVGEGDFSVAVCLFTRNCTILNPVCRRSGLVCEEPQSEGVFDSASCVVPTSCDDLKCNPGMVCRVFNGDVSGSGSGLSTLGPSTIMPTLTFSTPTPIGTSSGSTSTSNPVTPTSPTPETVARCIPDIQTSCDELKCEFEGDQVCILLVLPSRDMSLASCTSRNLVPTPIQESPNCNNTGSEACSQSGLLCVDLLQGGNQVTFSCVQANCMNGKGFMCTPDASCVSLPVSERGIRSACIQTAVQFEYGSVCRDRMCPETLTCQEIDLEGDVVGTICNTPAVVLSMSVRCDNTECADEQECVQYEADGTPFQALCLSSAIVDTLLEASLPQRSS